MQERQDGNEAIEVRWRSWVWDQLNEHEWTRKQLQDEINRIRRARGEKEISYATVHRWFLPVDHHRFRLPTYRSCLDIADAFQVSRDDVVRISGRLPASYDYGDDTLTELQRNAISTVRLLQDDQLEYLYPQMLALVRVRYREAPGGKTKDNGRSRQNAE